MKHEHGGFFYKGFTATLQKTQDGSYWGIVEESPYRDVFVGKTKDDAEEHFRSVVDSLLGGRGRIIHK